MTPRRRLATGDLATLAEHPGWKLVEARLAVMLEDDNRNLASAESPEFYRLQGRAQRTRYFLETMLDEMKREIEREREEADGRS